MSTVIAAMITAVVGILGTLFAPLLQQRMTARQRAEDGLTEDRRRRFEERRAAYTAMNRASRQFHTLLKDALHRIRDDVYADEDRVRLEEARRDYRDRYAEAQMIVPSGSWKRPASSIRCSPGSTRWPSGSTAACSATARRRRARCWS
ncbi:hypothetical protein SVIO_067070 [Streptomyces violaceusniger]|uniref:SMODS and SLOG-associating 2TM effector domain-containing protein n=1 Tax=Streptomyces violaceusniger TaxID=68280 RepID=A0A4D4L6N5_STRVO|nr:hypothetical protein SVIO_067070 [Streptomyces violaceusniger]